MRQAVVLMIIGGCALVLLGLLAGLALARPAWRRALLGPFAALAGAVLGALGLAWWTRPPEPPDDEADHAPDPPDATPPHRPARPTPDWSGPLRDPADDRPADDADDERRAGELVEAIERDGF